MAGGAGIAVLAGFSIVSILIYRTAYTNSVKPADAIVVLGARQTNGVPSPVFQARLDEAYSLYSTGLAPLLILTGGYGEGEVVSEAETGRRYLLQQGVPAGALLAENTGTTTWQSLTNIVRIAEEASIQRIIVVSDGFHLWRAKKMATDLGFTVYTVPAKSSPIADNALAELRYVLREHIVVLLYVLFSV